MGLASPIVSRLDRSAAAGPPTTRRKGFAARRNRRPNKTRSGRPWRRRLSRGADTCVSSPLAQAASELPVAAGARDRYDVEIEPLLGVVDREKCHLAEKRSTGAVIALRLDHAQSLVVPNVAQRGFPFVGGLNRRCG